jgi:4-amino-4-deoxy-L-arabinose transferase-like glycosyltransferase
MSRLVSALMLGTLAFAGALAITSGAGPGLDPDSMSYLTAAHTLTHDGKLRDVDRDWFATDSTMPLAHWPPGYPIAIAGAERAGMGGIQGARIIGALAASVSIAAIVWLVSGTAGVGAGIVAAVVVMVTPAVVQVHESVLSEPLFIALLVLTLWAMVRLPDRPLVAGVCAGLASIVRYAGVSLVGAAMLWSLLRSGSLRQRIARAVVAGIPAALLQGAWVLRTMHSAGPGSIRKLSIYGEITSTLREGWATASAWLVPGMSQSLGIFVAAGIAVLVVVAIWESRRIGTVSRAVLAVALLAGCYVALVLASRVIADPGIPLDDRMMAPLLVLLEIAIVLAVVPAWRGWPRAGRVALVIALVAWCAAALRVSVGSARYAVGTGNDFAEDCWRDSPVAAWVRTQGAGRPVYSNVPEALYFHAHRFAHEPPDEFNASTLLAFADTLARRRALLVVFDETCGNLARSVDSMTAQLPLREVAALPTGRVYESRGDSGGSPRAPSDTSGR